MGGRVNASLLMRRRRSGAPSPITADFMTLDATTMPTWFSHSRAGHATYFDNTGKITFAPNNLLVNTSLLSGAQTVSVGLVSGGLYILSFLSTGSASDSLAISGGLGTVLGDGASSGGRVYLKFTSNATSLVFTPSGTVANAMLERVTYQTTPRAYVYSIASPSAQYYGPRFDYNPLTLAARGLFIETDADTVSVLQSTFASSWTSGGASAANEPSATTSPDGTYNAAKISNTGTSPVSPVIYQNFTSAKTTSPHTVYAKAGTVNFLTIGTFDGTTVKLSGVNLTTGVADITASGHTIATEELPNGWWKVTLTYTYPGSTKRMYVGFHKNSGSSSYTPTVIGGDYIYAWGAGDSNTSYIPTASSSVTRAAEPAQPLTGVPASICNADIGAAIVQVILQSADSVVDILTTSSSRKLLFTDSSNTQISSTDGSTRLDATIGGSGTLTGGSVRAAVKWVSSENKRAIVANNGTLTSDAVSLGAGANTYIAQTAFRGWVQKAEFYSVPPTDAILKTNSTVV